jgi:hypothetical protein
MNFTRPLPGGRLAHADWSLDGPPDSARADVCLASWDFK